MITGTPPAEVDIDAKLVRELLREQHADLAALPIRATESGWDNAMYRLGDELAVRLPRRQVGAQLIEHELRWLPLLAPRLPLDAPAPVRAGAPEPRYPWPWSIVRWLSGTPADLEPPAPGEGETLARFLRALHVPAPADAPRNPYRGVSLEHRAAVVEERLTRLASRTNVISRAVRHVWRAALQSPMDGAATWVHGDLHPRNVLIANGCFIAVIDWGDLSQGDRATDLAALWTLLPDRDSRCRAMAALHDASSSTWMRARGWAVFFGVTLLDTGLVNDPRHARVGEQVLKRVTEGP